MDLPKALIAAIAPPLCAACGRLCGADAVVCPGCERRLQGLEPLRSRGPQGVDSAWSSAPHDGVARDLVAALKFRRLLPVAGLMAERIAWLAPAGLLSGELVPTPTSRRRTLARGFDPAAELAAELRDCAALPLRECLVRRGGGRQVGRRRAQRLGQPPQVFCRGPVPRSVVLVDDVLTTGATVSACSRALREGGARRIVAVTFARRL